MITRAFSVCFEGIEPQLVEIECAISPGLPAFSVIGLPDIAVSEARDRIRSALGALSIALPSRRITINLSPADMPKEGSHLDLPIALALLAALNIITHEDSEGALAIGELSLDGRLQPVVGALPAALKAAELSKDLYCPETSGAEAAWVDATRVFATKSMMAIIQHLTGQAPREPVGGTTNHPTKIYVGHGRGARTRTRKTRLGNRRGGPSSCVFDGATWVR